MNNEDKIMGDYNVVIRIGTMALSEGEAIDEVSDILFFIKEHLFEDTYSINVEKVGEYL